MSSISKLVAAVLLTAGVTLPISASAAESNPPDQSEPVHDCTTVSIVSYDVSHPTKGVRSVTKVTSECTDGFVKVTRYKSPWLLAHTLD